MKVPTELTRLINRFEENLGAYRSGSYNETQVRVEFIDPFLRLLGWDVDNSKGMAEQYKEVVHEDKVKVAGSTKAPDYSLRIGGQRKLFVEAKKPSINIKQDTAPAFQVRRYAWSAKLPLSILTDFEEFAVYDCRDKPDKNDKASHARIMYCTFREYEEKWDELTSLFSPNAIMQGAFEEYVQTSKNKRGTEEVDDAFLAEISEWREELARNIALHNPSIKTRNLNHAVQRTIDRLIFLRIAEDRGIEVYGRLQDKAGKTDVYENLAALFRQADAKYNSGLFHFKAEKGRADESLDSFTLNLTIDDTPLRKIIKRLYYPDSPYQFDVIPADILGQVYEQFLGKVIRLTSDGNAKIEEKPEVKKAGGVYYTPTYIVDYIVKHTLEALVSSRKPGRAGGVSKLRILDPACGSGSFLIGAYQFLLDWHLGEYLKEPTRWSKGKEPALIQSSNGDWRLTISERKRILLNNIYGVDIDPQAVEVTKLSLLLKVMEGETEQTIGTQLALLPERVLPDLNGNILCGNSLVGSDYYDGQMSLGIMDEEEMYRINVFDWPIAFPKIISGGGFDAIIGNPPWGAQFSPEELAYHRKRNKAIIVRMIDSFMYFVHQTSMLLKSKGLFGMILPDVILYQSGNEKLRRYLADKFSLNVILNMGDVFEKVTRPTSILIFQSSKVTKSTEVNIADFSEIPKVSKVHAINDFQRYEQLAQRTINTIPSSLFVTSNPEHFKVWSKANSVRNRKLSAVVDKDGIQRGVSPDLKKAFLVDQETISKWNLETDKLKPTLTGGKHIKRYFIEYPDLQVVYATRKDNFELVPNIKSFIDQYKDEITCKEVQKNKHPLYSLHRPRKEQIFTKSSKFVGVITGDRIILAIDSKQAYPTDGAYLFGVRTDVDPSFLIGIMNSRLFVFLYRLLTMEKGRVLAQVKPTVLNHLPIRHIDPSVAPEKKLHDELILNVVTIMKLNDRIASAKTAHERTLLQRQIYAKDRQIDQLVYKLYELTDDEITLVESIT